MTRKSEGATAGLRRGRTLATAGLGAATLIGGLVYAMPANAATNPTASVTMPASILNDGSAAGTATITLTGGDVTYNNLSYKFTLTVPGNSTCTSVTVAPSATNPGPAGTLSGCVFTATALQSVAANSAATPGNYDITVNSPSSTGNLSLAFELDQTDGAGGFLRTLATASGSSALVGPTAATFNTVPNAIINQDYTQKLFTPSVGGTGPTTTVYKTVSNTTAAGVTTTCYVLDSTTNPVNGVTYTVLNDGLNLDPATGTVISNPTATATANVNKAAPITGQTDSNPAKYVVIINNGQGGASGTTTSTACSDPAIAGGLATLPVAQHDVSSGPFQIPVVFKDVPLNGTFATAIYSLGDAGTSTGYADGSYQPTNAISREAMAALLSARAGGPGNNQPCDGTTVGVYTTPNGTSPYSDVPFTSQFCGAIAYVSSLGIFNGYAGGTFHPTASISRQAIAATMFRTYSYDRLGTTDGDAACSTPVPFNDVSAQSPFCGDIEWMKTNGLSTGYSDGGFHPTADSSRQATAQFLYKLDVLENA